MKNVASLKSKIWQQTILHYEQVASSMWKGSVGNNTVIDRYMNIEQCCQSNEIDIKTTKLLLNVQLPYYSEQMATT